MLECVVNLDVQQKAKKLAGALFVVGLGLLGVAGGNRTLHIFKHWIVTFFNRQS